MHDTPSVASIHTGGRLPLQHNSTESNGEVVVPLSPGLRPRITANHLDPGRLEGMERPRPDGKAYTSLQTEEDADMDHKDRHAHVPGVRYHQTQKIFLTAWNVICGCTIFVSLWNAEPDHLDLFYIYYQSLIPLLVMLWLWGVCVRLFERQHVQYNVCFSQRDQRYLLSSREIFQVANLVTTFLATSAAIFTFQCTHGYLEAAKYQPPLLYCSVFMLFLLPVSWYYKETRLFFSSTLFRVMTPFREVTWADFLLADVVTSLAKALSDSERAVCHLVAGPVLQPHTTDQVCGSSSWIIPLGLSLPYVWRFLQCIRVYMDTGATPQIFNAIKYSTAFPVIILSSMKYQVAIEDWNGFYKPLWLLSAFINSAYSYYWDIERDWEIQYFTAQTGEKWFFGILNKPQFKTELQYPKPFYYYLMVSNLFLRLSWTYKLSPHLRRNQFTVLIFVLLEVFRRFQWIFVRIEVELRKLQHQQPALGQLVPAVPKASTKHETSALL